MEDSRDSNFEDGGPPLTLGELEAQFELAASVLKDHLEEDLRIQRKALEDAQSSAGSPMETQEADGNASEEDITSSVKPNGKPITARQRLREGKKAETAAKVADKDRILNNRLHAIIQENPFRFKAGSRQNHQAWENVAKALVKKNLLEDTPQARNNLQKKLSRLLTDFRKVYRTRPTGDEPPPMNETDKLVAEIDKLKESGVFQKKADPKAAGAEMRKSIALIGMRTAVKIRDVGEDDEGDDGDPMDDAPEYDARNAETRSVRRFDRDDSLLEITGLDMPPNVPPKSPDEAVKGSAEKKKPPGKTSVVVPLEKQAEKPVRLTRDKQLMNSFETIAGSIGQMNNMQMQVWKEEREEIIQERTAVTQRFQMKQEAKAKEKEMEREDRAKEREAEKQNHAVMVGALKDVLTAAFSAAKPS